MHCRSESTICTRSTFRGSSGHGYPRSHQTSAPRHKQAAADSEGCLRTRRADTRRGEWQSTSRCECHSYVFHATAPPVGASLFTSAVLLSTAVQPCCHGATSGEVHAPASARTSVGLALSASLSPTARLSAQIHINLAVALCRHPAYTNLQILAAANSIQQEQQVEEVYLKTNSLNRSLVCMPANEQTNGYNAESFAWQQQQSVGGRKCCHRTGNNHVPLIQLLYKHDPSPVLGGSGQ